MSRVGLSRSTIYEYMSLNQFPRPVPLGSRNAVGWVESEIDAWIDTCIAKARPEGPA